MRAVATGIDSGQRVGRYEPIRRLAVGGMAEIFLARVPGVGIEGFEKLVVLKRILPQHALDPELLRMFLDKARLSATTNDAKPRPIGCFQRSGGPCDGQAVKTSISS